jgi:hypothetical protein
VGRIRSASMSAMGPCWPAQYLRWRRNSPLITKMQAREHGRMLFKQFIDWFDWSIYSALVTSTRHFRPATPHLPRKRHCTVIEEGECHEALAPSPGVVYVGIIGRPPLGHVLEVALLHGLKAIERWHLAELVDYCPRVSVAESAWLRKSGKYGNSSASLCRWRPYPGRPL